MTGRRTDKFDGSHLRAEASGRALADVGREHGPNTPLFVGKTPAPRETQFDRDMKVRFEQRQSMDAASAAQIPMKVMMRSFRRLTQRGASDRYLVYLNVGGFWNRRLGLVQMLSANKT